MTIPMRCQGAMVVDWQRVERPACGLIPACVQWSAGYGFRRALVTAWGSGPAEVECIAPTGDRTSLPAAPTVQAARAAAESWLMGA